MDKRVVSYLIEPVLLIEDDNSLRTKSQEHETASNVKQEYGYKQRKKISF